MNKNIDSKKYSIIKLIHISFILTGNRMINSSPNGNRTMKMYTSTERILLVDHWPPKREDMQLIILIILNILIILIISIISIILIIVIIIIISIIFFIFYYFNILYLI